MVAEGFLSNENKQMLIIEENPEKLLNKFKSYKHPDVERLINEKIKSARGK
jgi:predicted Rossmann-fold nucleotide-binding protein